MVANSNRAAGKQIVYACGLCLSNAMKWLHSSEKRGLRSTFCPRKMLQNMLCLCKRKTHVVFTFSILSNFEFNASLYQHN